MKFTPASFRAWERKKITLLARPPACKTVRVLVLYEPAHLHALDRLRQRFRLDAELTLPVKESDIEGVLRGWQAVDKT